MASFTPDPKKRDFLLPTGCKDLHDVLRLQQHLNSPALSEENAIIPFGPDDSWFVEGPLVELENHLREMAKSDAAMRTLLLAAPDHSFNVDFTQVKGSPLTASLALEIGTERERAMREFCVRHKFPLPVNTAIPAGFRPDLPVFQIYRLNPLPTDLAAAAGKVLTLYWEVAGLDETTHICFHH